MTLQDWINQSCKNEICLEQACFTEIRCHDDQSQTEDQHTNMLLHQHEAIMSKMTKDQNNKDNNKDNEEDWKPSAQEKKQDDKPYEDEDTSEQTKTNQKI